MGNVMFGRYEDREVILVGVEEITRKGTYGMVSSPVYEAKFRDSGESISIPGNDPKFDGWFLSYER